MNRMDGKVVLITGGAGSIGAATARLMVAEGASVVAVDVVESDVPGAVSVLADVTDSEAVREAVAVCVDRFGGLDVAFANAGVFGVVSADRRLPRGRVPPCAGRQRRSARSWSPSTRWR